MKIASKKVYSKNNTVRVRTASEKKKSITPIEFSWFFPDLNNNLSPYIYNFPIFFSRTKAYEIENYYITTKWFF